MEQLEKEVDRYFQLYGAFCAEPSVEIVNNLVSSAFRCNERLKKATFNRQSFGLDQDFFILRALRNYFTHSGDLDLEIQGFGKELHDLLKPELGSVCLVPKKIVSAAVNHTENFDLAKKVNSTLQEIGSYVDIHPYIFNFSVKLFEKSFRLNVHVSNEMYDYVKTAYKFEKIYKIEHFVNPCSLDLSVIEGDVGSYMVPLSTYVVVREHQDKHRNSVGMHFFHEELKPEYIDFESVIDEFIEKTKTLNGIPIEVYSPLLDNLFSWNNSSIPSKLRMLLDIDEEYIGKFIVEILSFMEPFPSEKIRFEILKSKKQVIEQVFVKLLNERYEKQFNYLIFCALIVAGQIAKQHEEEPKKLERILEFLLFGNNTDRVDSEIDKLTLNGRDTNAVKRAVMSQALNMLVEFPYDEFICDSVI